MTQIQNAIQFAFNYLSTIRFIDLVDMAIVAYILYKIAKFIKETKALQVLQGILVLLVLMQVSEWLKMYTINYLLRNTMQFGVLAILLLFQPELRRALERVGKTKLKGFSFFGFKIGSVTGSSSITEDVIFELGTAASELSRMKTGAIIVIERQDNVLDIAKNGTEIDAKVTASLLCSLFYSGSPMHDGAVIIKDNKLAQAACVLPLYQNVILSRELGTRHRAAVAMSEACDALVLVVSEETGKISLAREGNLQRNLKKETLEQALLYHLIGKTNQDDEMDDSKKEKKAKKDKAKNTSKEVSL